MAGGSPLGDSRNRVSVDDVNAAALRFLIDALLNPLSKEPGSGRTRVSIEAGTVAATMSGTWTVGLTASQTLGNLTQLATFSAKDTLLNHQMEAAWQLAIRSKVT